MFRGANPRDSSPKDFDLSPNKTMLPSSINLRGALRISRPCNLLRSTQPNDREIRN